MKKKLFILLLPLFLFMNSVHASDKICSVWEGEYDYQRAFLGIYETDENHAGAEEVLLRTYNESLEKFIKDYNWGQYVVSLSVIVTEGSTHAISFSFKFLGSPIAHRPYDTGLFIGYKKSIHYTYVLSENGVYIFSKEGGTPNYSATAYNNLKYVDFIGSGCAASPLMLFAGNVVMDWEKSDYLVPVYNTEYTHQSLGSAAPYVSENWIPEIFTNTYKTLSLDVAPYLVLSLPDYTVEPYDVKIFAKGEFCFTPVYDYGTAEKSDPSSNGCYSYGKYTALTISISREDLDNHAVYYVSNYSGASESSIKINSDSFNYKYIYDSNNPTLTIGNNIYNIIPYDKLSTSAKTNTEDGVIPGQSCQLGDLGCTAENDPNVSGFDNLIDNILNFGGTIWNSVVNFMSLVTNLLSVLPPDFQQAVLVCFTFGLIVGCVKIFIG